MQEITKRLHENRQIQLAKEILESNGYKVEKRVSEGLFDNKQKKSEEYNEAIEKHLKKSLSEITRAAHKAVSAACIAFLGLSDGETTKQSDSPFTANYYAVRLSEIIEPLIDEYSNPKAANKGGSILMDVMSALRVYKQKDVLISNNINELVELDKLIDQIQEIEKIGSKAYVYAKEAVNKTIVDYFRQLKDILHKKYYVK